MFDILKSEMDKFKIRKYDEREKQFEENRIALLQNPNDFIKIEFKCKSKDVKKVLEILKLLEIEVI